VKDQDRHDEAAEPAGSAADVVLGAQRLGFPWVTADPFLFCVHHDDAYPAGNEAMGPAASLAGRHIGQDFEGKDGWRMYHGDVVPGFPQHPHRGFETVTVVRRGLVDHADSLGATARYGEGDVQWLTAGRGIVHSEMFPLVKTDAPNPAELFQIWLNLPSADKMAEPSFTMLWAPKIPKLVREDDEGRKTWLTIVAGTFEHVTPPSPPPHSWARRPESEVAIWTLKMEPGARFAIPAASPGLNRVLYFFRGDELIVAGGRAPVGVAIAVRPDRVVELEAGDAEVEILMLQGRPNGEPVVQYGPFVMNSEQEIRQTFADYQRTKFGGWPWPEDGPVHPREAGRRAKHPDGHEEEAPAE
jgi:redox-sensitive bicupin YhaK (pirin superfamily)